MVKRAFDITLALIGLLLLAPLLVLLAVAIKLDSQGPVFYRQWRLGKDQRPFRVLKFRTMVVGAEGVGPAITVGSDPRITRVGWILRRFELDELPTLINVLRGEMSIVGPRPELPKYLPYYTEAQKRVFLVRPGLTDLGTLAFRDEARHLRGDAAEEQYVREILPRKLALNLEYIKRQSLRHDLGIIVRTLRTIALQPKG